MLATNKLLSLVSNRFLELIILPTEQCNFRCVYCYEDFSIGKMKRNTLEAIKKLILERASELDVLKVSWFGGEPLAAKDIIFELSQYVISLQKWYPRLQFISGMTTNGYLLNEAVLTKLVQLGVTNYQISLDGTEVLHDQTRIRLDGAGTFKKIWQNLIAAKNTDLLFLIVIRIHLTPENLDDIRLLVDQIKSTFGHDPRFSIFFKAIENLGGPNSGTFKTVRKQDKHEILEQFNQSLGDVLQPKRLNDDGPYVCYAAQTNSFVIRADGKIGKCTVAFSDDRNYLGELNDDGTLNIAPDKLALWTRGIKSQQLDELCCPMSKMPNLTGALKNISVKVISANG